MRDRFEGLDGRRRLVAALQAQKAVEGNASLAEALAGAAEVQAFDGGEVLIQEGASDDEVYFVLVGKLSIHVKGKRVAERSIRDHVGEMAAIDPSQPRSATVIADGPCVVAKIAEPALAEIANMHPGLWRNMAKELSRRLVQRNDLIRPCNEQPRAFVICSTEALSIAQEVQSALSHDDIMVVVWTDGIFFASSYPLEVLEQALDDSDFAIAIARPDDVIQSRGESQSAPRDNVVFELGMFVGRLGRRRTVLLQPESESLKIPSDLHGLAVIKYKVGPERDMPALLAPACHQIRKLVKELGVKS